MIKVMHQNVLEISKQLSRKLVSPDPFYNLNHSQITLKSFSKRLSSPKPFSSFKFFFKSLPFSPFSFQLKKRHCHHSLLFKQKCRKASIVSPKLDGNFHCFHQQPREKNKMSSVQSTARNRLGRPAQAPHSLLNSREWYDQPEITQRGGEQVIKLIY